MFQTKTKQVIGFLSAACSASSALAHAEYVQKETSNAYAQTTYVESDANQLTGMLDKRRVDVTASNLAVINIFDNGAFVHDAHTQYMKWALLSPLAYDFTADARSYSRAAAIEYFHDETNLTVDVEVFSRGSWNDRASIGDGRLNHQPEDMPVPYYGASIANPAYNEDREPVNVGSIRVYTQFSTRNS